MTPEALIIESMFSIVSKNGDDVPFVLNEAQRRLDENLTGRDIVPKARQEGVSSYFLGRYTAACLSRRNVKAVIISHEGEATQRLLSRCEYFLSHIRGPKANVGRSSLNAITFPKMDSMIYIGTAGSKKFGRGDTITHLHCSEYAFWQNPTETFKGLAQAVPLGGEIGIESTGKGVGNDYHKRCVRAFEGKSQYRCHFLAWHTFPEYTLELSPEEEIWLLKNLDEDLEEHELVGHLTPGQLAWRRMKLEEMDYDIGSFKQEYPMTLDECFQASGDSIFRKVYFVPSDQWVEHDEIHRLWVKLPHPIPGRTYTLGVDPSGGTGNDNAAVQVVCLDTREQVGEFAYNKIEPDVLGLRVIEIAELFNMAFVTVESNNHGPVTLKTMLDANWPEYLLYSMHTSAVDFEDRTLMKLGIRTTSRTKPLMVGRLRHELAQGLRVYSPLLNGELSTFVEHENGEMKGDEGCLDDRVMALACAVMGMSQAGLMAMPINPTSRKARAVNPFGLDGILEELQSRGRRFGLEPQSKSSERVRDVQILDNRWHG